MRVTWKAAFALAALVVASSPVRAAPADNEPPEITPGHLEVPDPGKPLVVECDIADPSGVFDPLVYWRPEGSKEFSRSSLKRTSGTHYRAEIVLPPNVKAVEYLLEAYDENGNGPARVGTQALPLKASLEPPTATPSPKTPEGEGDTPDDATSHPTTTSGLRLPLPALAAAVGSGVLLVTSGVFGTMASRDYDAFKATYDPVKRPARARSVRTESLVADTMLVLGLASAGLSAYLFATAPAPEPSTPDEQEDKAHVVLVPSLQGLLVRGSF